ncbi:aminotransferase class IV [Leucobacter luti]|uniref:aminotransferase class IV n=1 Tax=Leucobacter luti TaxID=340320 RepID=UPI003D041262
MVEDAESAQEPQSAAGKGPFGRLDGDAGAPALLVADSFRVRVRVRGGIAEARAPEAHLRRFARGVRAATAHRGAAQRPGELDAFLADAMRRIADFGAGFPRLELWAASKTSTGAAQDPARLALSLRPLPQLGTEIRLRTTTLAAPEHADVKGPNIAEYAALNRELGAETLLLDPRTARVREGATTSIILWEGDRAFVSDAPDRVASVTEALLAQAENEPPPPAQLTRERLTAPGAEVWAVNALHGIRPVTSIDGVPTAAPDPARLAAFRAILDGAWRPIAPQH